MKKLLLVFLIALSLLSCSKEDPVKKDSDIIVCIKVTNRNTKQEVNLTCSNLAVWKTGKFLTQDYQTYYENIHYIEINSCDDCKR